LLGLLLHLPSNFCSCSIFYLPSALCLLCLLLLFFSAFYSTCYPPFLLHNPSAF
jgi:hypothetical protein